MKQRICVMMAMTLTLLASGQALCQLPMTFGVKAGMAVSNLDIDSEYVEFESVSNFTGGGFVVVALPGLFDIQAEVLFVTKGSKTTQSYTDDTGGIIGGFETNYDITYLEIPVLAKISLGPTPAHVLVGPSLGFKGSSQIKKPADDIIGQPASEEDWDGLSGTDIGFVIGLGAELSSAVGTIVVDARYTLGLSNIDDGAVNVDLKNKTMMLMAGIAF